MDIFLQKCINSLQKAFVNPPEPCGVLLHLHFTFMHLADAFIQSDLHCIQVTVSTSYQLLLSLGIEPMILALLAPCSTIELQEGSFMMDRCIFKCFKISTPFTAFIKTGRARTFFNVTPTVFI